jgi:hypothetical protein
MMVSNALLKLAEMGRRAPRFPLRLIARSYLAQRSWTRRVRHWHVEAQGHTFRPLLQRSSAPATLPQSNKSPWPRPIRSVILPPPFPPLHLHSLSLTPL